MDLLFSSYGSEDEEEEEAKEVIGTSVKLTHPAACRRQPDLSSVTLKPSPSSIMGSIEHTHLHSTPSMPQKSTQPPHTEARRTSQPVGGYISKRKRKGGESEVTSQSLNPSSANLLAPYLTSVTDPLHSGESSIRKQARHISSVPRHTKHIFTEHSKPVLSLEWHPYDARLLLSSSLDGDIRLWDSEKGSRCVAAYNLHSGAVRDVEWVTSETAISAGYDCTAVYMDAGYGKEIVRLKHSAYVSVATVHPSDFNLVLTGDFDGKLQMWDLRTSGIVKNYKGACGKILDAVFLPHGKMFVASTDIVRKNAFSQAMNVWDVDSGVTLTHQLYFEPFSCPCLRVSGNGEEFLAQSNGNYVVLFSAQKPFKLNKRKRFQGHYVAGFDVGFDLNPEGTVLCSASSEGKVHFYNYTTTRVIHTLALTDSACLAVAWNQVSPTQVAVSDWKGKIYILTCQ